MAGENEQETDTTEVEERDDDFDAGFTGATTTPAPAPAAEEGAAPPAPTPEPTPSPTQAPAPEYVQVTKQELERLTAAAAKIEEIGGTVNKKFDTAFGQMGALKQMIAKLQTETPAGDAVEASAEDFADLQEQYPELADLTLRGLNKALAKLKGTGGQPVDMKAFDAKAAQTRGEVIDMTLDTVVDGDWRAQVYANGKDPSDGFTAAYSTFIDTQPQDVKALAESDKLRDASRLMRLFKAHKDAPPAPAPSQPPAATPAPTTPPAASTTRRSQVAAAVPPRGDGGHAPARAEEDDFNAGFNYRKPG